MKTAKAKTKIEWCDATWNPVTGCTPISAGCQNCWARRMASRQRGRNGYPADDPFQVTFHRDRLDEPLHWQNPRRIAVCLMGDLWHPEVKAEDRAAVVRATNVAPQHTYLFLTKRPELLNVDFSGSPHLWIGTSVENQTAADERIPWLLKCPLAVRFLSMEPLLGPVDLRPFMHTHRCNACEWIGFADEITDEDEDEEPVCPGCGFSDQFAPRMDMLWSPGVEMGEAERRCRENRHSPIDWVIVGCESGPGRRPMKLEWVRSIAEQCRAAGVPLFIKQLEIDGKVSHDPAEWPEDLRIREFP